MNQQTKLLFIAAGFAALSGCGGGGSDSPASSPAPAQAPALAPVAAPDYLVTDSSCAADLTAFGKTATVGKIDDVAAYFGSYAVSFALGGTATFSLQHPGTATLKGVTMNLKSVCLVAENGANWRYVSLTDGNLMNMDASRTIGARLCANGDDFSTTGLRGIFFGCKP
ncbi:MAG: hypothetical protein WB821_00760 [Burkholderiaceae bacterium]